MSKVIKIANCSGFYGDNLSIAKKMVLGGPIDVLTGDYLAELTMTILYNQISLGISEMILSLILILNFL